jgi:hypothetical protein
MAGSAILSSLTYHYEKSTFCKYDLRNTLNAASLLVKTAEPVTLYEEGSWKHGVRSLYNRQDGALCCMPMIRRSSSERLILV